MTAIEHRELKGITLKNLIVTIVSTASIVASVMTTYFSIKADIQEIKTAQQTEAKIDNIRINMLESQVALLQKEIDEIKRSGIENISSQSSTAPKTTAPALFSANGPILNNLKVK